MPCTTLLVGKAASYDGSTIVARNEDAPSGQFTAKRFAVVLPADQPRRYRSVLSHVEVELPDDPMPYTSLPNALDDEGVWGEAGVNTANVSMSATETLTTNERVLGADPLVELVAAHGAQGDPDYRPETPGGIGEEDMLTLVLPYVRTAREGVRRLGELLERYGTYEMNGIAFSDADEIWWLETVGGHHWIARRVPDDAYVVMPNQLGIDSFDLEDAYGEQRDHMCSPDLRPWMSAAHLDLTLDGDARIERAASGVVFNPRHAFGSASDADHVYNTPRSWAIQRFLNPHACDWDASRAGNASGSQLGPESDDIPWARRPERKVTIEDVKYALSLHYQGTPFDPYATHGDPALRDMYRPIGINRNCELSVVQLRPYVPAALSAVQWVALGCNAYNALVPLYANVRRAPEYLANTGERVTTDSFYWANRLIASMADAHYNLCIPHVERYQLKVGGIGRALLARTDGALRQATADAPVEDDAIAERLAAANDEMCAELRAQTDKLLGEVLYTASCQMRNGFARSDG
ncbi:MAG: C69 family dipeptidase [Coriobacteriales bacterium]|jgi:dipeptidase